MKQAIQSLLSCDGCCGILWANNLFSLKDAIEVAHVVITALKTDFGNGLGGVYQQARGISQAYIDDIIT